MSIRDEIASRVGEGRLFPLTPRLPDLPIRRNLFLSEEINRFIEGPWDSVGEEKRWGEVRATFETFVTGKVITMCLKPFEADKAYMGRLDPIEKHIWDIRCRKKKGLRFIGAFAEPDTFVALNWDVRENMGNRNDPKWKEIIRRCESSWRVLFPTYSQHQGITINDYVTESAEDSLSP